MEARNYRRLARFSALGARLMQDKPGAVLQTESEAQTGAILKEKTLEEISVGSSKRATRSGGPLEFIRRCTAVIRIQPQDAARSDCLRWQPSRPFQRLSPISLQTLDHLLSFAAVMGKMTRISHLSMEFTRFAP